MSPTILSTTVQSATLKVSANLVAQILSNHNETVPLSIDVRRTALFGVFGLIATPLNSLWQEYLEKSFPTQYPKEQQQPSPAKRAANGSVAPVHKVQSNGTLKHKPAMAMNWSNVLIKLLLDQTIGQVVMNSTFIIVTKWPQSDGIFSLFHYIYANLWTILQASWRLWPWVALFNFVFVPVAWRVLVASLVGFGWNIFLSFLSARM